MLDKQKKSSTEKETDICPAHINSKIPEAVGIIKRAETDLNERGWLIKPGSDVRRLFASVYSLSEKSDKLNDKEWRSKFLSATHAIRIANAISTAIKDPGSKAAIRKVIGSTMNLFSDKHSEGKDALWELDLYRRFKLGGVVVRFGEPDLIISLGEKGEEYAIACKKTYSLKNIENTYKRARKQLKDHEIPGVVAFNLDSFTLYEPVWEEESPVALRDRLNKMNTEFIERNKRLFSKASRDEFCDGVIVATSVVSHIAKDRLPISTSYSSAAHRIEKNDYSAHRFNRFVECFDKILTTLSK